MLIDANALAHARDARAQAADAAHDEVDLDAGLRRAIERVDHLGVDERVHLADDARRPAGRARAPPRARSARGSASRMFTGATSSLRYSRWREIAGERVEQIAHVGADRRAAGEQTDVGVEARRARVVVAAAEVDVAANAVGLAPDDERRLRVRLERRRAERDVHAGVLELCAPTMMLFASSKRALSSTMHRHLLAALRRLDERARRSPCRPTCDTA